MIAHIIRDLDLLRHRVATRNTRIAAPQRRIIHTLAFGKRIRAEAITREPIIPITRLADRTIGAIPASLARDFSAV